MSLLGVNLRLYTPFNISGDVKYYGHGKCKTYITKYKAKGRLVRLETLWIAPWLR